MEAEIALAESLFAPYLPNNSTLSIEVNDATFGEKYLYRLTYYSEKSGRTICIVAKGDSLPTCDSDGCLMFYKRQLVLTPSQVAHTFHRQYLFDRNAKRQKFLFEEGRPKAKRGITIVDTEAKKDYLPFEQQHLIRTD